MNRLQLVADAVGKGGKLLCPFLTAGYPSVEATADLLLAAQAGGAGILELGIPFSDPVADGPVIQASFTEALAKGATVRGCLGAVAAARKRGLTVPVLAMVSFSIVFKRGTEEFARMCAQDGLDGVILPDIPLEEAPAIVDVMREAGLRTSLLIAPTTVPGRRQAIARLCDAFAYYLSVSGITGERKTLPADIGPNVAALRPVCTVPICVGFGISTAAQVREVVRGAGADGAIVGSAVIRRVAEKAGKPVGEQAEAVRGLVAELATGLKE
jgi:tryptophan synthase alpha chain